MIELNFGKVGPVILSNPKFRYKDSGVEWLGKIPEHWNVWKATHGFKDIGSGTTPKSDNPLYYDGDIPWVTTSELRETVITDTNHKITKEALADYSTLKKHNIGDVVIAMYGATILQLKDGEQPRLILVFQF